MPAPAQSRQPSARPDPGAVAGLDRSCQLPLLLFFVSALGWLLLGSFAELLASIKLHSSTLLSTAPWSSYGRLRPAGNSAVLFGFLSQAGIATALWLICRLGRTTLLCTGPLIAGWAVWNLGVTAGVGGILAGESTGFAGLEMPVYGACVVGCAYFVIGVSALLTFRSRTEREMYPSLWYLLAAFFVFPWIYSVAGVLLVAAPVRGVVQIAVQGWFNANFLNLWLTPLGLAVLLYYIPKLSGAALFSRQLQALAFWVLVFAGGLAAVKAGAPVPKWLVGISTGAGLILIIPAIATILNLHRTLGAGDRRADTAGLLPLFRFSTLAYAAAAVLLFITSAPLWKHTLQFTLMVEAVSQVAVYGFVGVALLTAMLDLIPRLLGTGWAKPAAARGAVWIVALGSAVITVSLVLGGLVQGAKFSDARVAFPAIMSSVLMPVRLGTVGWLMVFLGAAGAFAAYLHTALPLLAGTLCECCGCGASGTASKSSGPAQRPVARNSSKARK